MDRLPLCAFVFKTYHQETLHQELKHLNCPKTQPESHRATNLKFSLWFHHNKLYLFNLTSERKLVRVGFTKSVVVTLTFEEKEMSIIVWAVPSDSYTNLVWVLVVLQGRGQSDTRVPAAKSYRASKQNCNRWYVTTQQMLVYVCKPKMVKCILLYIIYWKELILWKKKGKGS